MLKLGSGSALAHYNNYDIAFRIILSEKTKMGEESFGVTIFTPSNIAALIIASSFAAGLNVYATVLTLGLLAVCMESSFRRGLKFSAIGGSSPSAASCSRSNSSPTKFPPLT